MLTNEAVQAEQSLLDMCALVVSLTGGQQLSTRFGDSFRPGFPAPSFYGRTALRGAADAQPQDVLHTVREADLMLVSYTQGSVPEALPALLPDAGYVPMVTQTGMLLRLEGRSFAAAPQVVRIGPDRIEAWGDVNCIAFDKPPEQPAFAAMVQCDDCFFYGYEEDGRLIGTTLLYTRNGNAGIHEVSVLPEYRRRGIGRALVEALCAEARARGARLLHLEGRASNSPALALYEASGFVRDGVRPNFYRKPAEDAVLMTKTL